MALVQLDLIPGSGDHLLTRDTTSHLDWLNLTATANRSYLEVLAGFGGFIGIYGFRYATNPEVTGLLDQFGFNYVSTPPGIPSNALPIETFIDFMNGKSMGTGMALSVKGIFQQTPAIPPSPPPTIPVIGIWMTLRKTAPGGPIGHIDSTLISQTGIQDPTVSSFLVKSF